jgi:hypothetical protein
MIEQGIFHYSVWVDLNKMEVTHHHKNSLPYGNDPLPRDTFDESLDIQTKRDGTMILTSRCFAKSGKRAREIALGQALYLTKHKKCGTITKGE